MKIEGLKKYNALNLEANSYLGFYEIQLNKLNLRPANMILCRV